MRQTQNAISRAIAFQNSILERAKMLWYSLLIAGDNGLYVAPQREETKETGHGYDTVFHGHGRVAGGCDDNGSFGLRNEGDARNGS